MKNIIDALTANGQVSDYKIVENKCESYQLFFVKGKLETVRTADTRDIRVTVYADHGEFKGDSSFLVYPSTTREDLTRLTDEAVGKALLIQNKTYTLPANETGSYCVESNFEGKALPELAEIIAKNVFAANTLENADLNSVEVFVNRYTDRVYNSRGVDKTQTRYDAMVEAIPTYNGETQSVELYQQYNFASLDEAQIQKEISEKLRDVKARYEAVTPDEIKDCVVILNKQELSELFENIVGDLNYSTVYARAGLFHKGDAIQKDPTGDKLNITMEGELPGNIRSAKFDGDGMALRSISVVEDGVAVNYYGANRFGQYLGEASTGNLRCMQVAAGSACNCLKKPPYLEVVSMSGLQVDTFNDYIGGEVRLAYYDGGEGLRPVTGISVTGKLSEVLSAIRFSQETGVYDGYNGPVKAILKGMQVF